MNKSLKKYYASHFGNFKPSSLDQIERLCRQEPPLAQFLWTIAPGKKSSMLHDRSIVSTNTIRAVLLKAHEITRN